MAKSDNVGGKKSVKDKVLDTIKDISQFYLYKLLSGTGNTIALTQRPFMILQIE